MPIVVNGTTIPENVANVLNVNGVNITSVVCDGVTVWTQSLNLTWSGNSFAMAGVTTGLEVSNNLYRWKSYGTSSAYGSWQTVNASGVFSGDSIYSTEDGIIVSSNLIKPKTILATAASWVTYNIGTKSFTGSSIAGSDPVGIFETSGGLLRYKLYAFETTTYGSYISLT